MKPEERLSWIPRGSACVGAPADVPRSRWLAAPRPCEEAGSAKRSHVGHSEPFLACVDQMAAVGRGSFRSLNISWRHNETLELEG